jgi:hypothetical protein
MASIVDAFNEALNENLSFVKFIIYGIPVYIVAQMFIVGKMSLFIFWGSILAVLLLGVLTKGINNVRRNRKEILTLNPIELIKSIVKTFIVLAPQCILYKFIGSYITTNFVLPETIPHAQQIFSIIIWTILFSVLLTSYISYAKYMKIKQAFNLKVILNSCIDILISFIFFIPQLLLAALILVGPVAYLFSFFNIPFTHWGFVAYCSFAFVIHLSILANVFAQIGFEQIKGSNEEYDENVQITSVIDTAIERMYEKE